MRRPTDFLALNVEELKNYKRYPSPQAKCHHFGLDFDEEGNVLVGQSEPVTASGQRQILRRNQARRKPCTVSGLGPGTAA
eukprot:464754-Rhodomonas_salina.2